MFFYGRAISLQLSLPSCHLYAVLFIRLPNNLSAVFVLSSSFFLFFFSLNYERTVLRATLGTLGERFKF